MVQPSIAAPHRIVNRKRVLGRAAEQNGRTWTGILRPVSESCARLSSIRHAARLLAFVFSDCRTIVTSSIRKLSWDINVAAAIPSAPFMLASVVVVAAAAAAAAAAADGDRSWPRHRGEMKQIHRPDPRFGSR